MNNLLKKLVHFPDLVEACKKNGTQASRKFRERLEMSNSMISALMQRCQDLEYIERKSPWRLTDSGRNAIILLDTYLHPVNKNEFDLKLKLATEQRATVQIESNSLDTKSRYLTLKHLSSANGFIYDIATSGLSFNTPTTISIKFPPISGPLSTMFFYIRKFVDTFIDDGSIPVQLGSHLPKDDRLISTIDRIYDLKWRNYLPEISKRYDQNFEDIDIVNFASERIGKRYAEMLKVIVGLLSNENECRDWINSNVVFELPDNWFIPIEFWKSIGFGVEYGDEGGPYRLVFRPHDEDFINLDNDAASFFELVNALERMRSYQKRSGGDNVLELPVDSNIPFLFKTENGYKNWGILRKDYEVLNEMSKLLDIALEAHIVSGTNQILNIREMCLDYFKKERSFNDIFDMALKGKYRI